ncbi:MAG: hypothetical protein IIB28_09985, partial [Chloroflexi bacterium]|nr:hypothetical protein [Chloroflexota bacterium]
MQRTIFHVDLDAFFAAVERVVNPDLIGKPLIVGGIGNRGVVSCASYEARKFGVHSAMPITIARRLCPQGVFVPASHSLYGSFSKRFMAILHDHSPLVQPVSVDEAYIDMTGTEKLFGPPRNAAENIRSRVHGDLKVTSGSYDRIDARGSVNVPITDNLYAKVSVATFNRDGFIDSPNALSGDNLGDVNRDSIRGALRFVPNDSFEAIFTADYSRQREDGVPHVRVAR